MPSKHLTEYNTLKGNALHFTRKLNTNQYTETLVQRRSFSDMFNVISYARVWRNNVSAMSRMLRAVAAAVVIILNVRCWPSARVASESCRIFPRDQSVHLLHSQIRTTRCEKSRFYPVLAKIRINRSLLYFKFATHEERKLFNVN